MSRQQEFPAQISAKVHQRQYDDLRELETTYPVSLATVIRDAIEAGLPKVKRRYANQTSRTTPEA